MLNMKGQIFYEWPDVILGMGECKVGKDGRYEWMDIIYEWTSIL